MENLDDTALSILEAANRRFTHYGYPKTTMSEIAEDCNMSTGNLYRYFPSKLDIAEAVVRQIRRNQVERLRETAQSSNLDPSEKLRRFLQLKLQASYQRFHGNPKRYELSLTILSEKPDFAKEWEAQEAAVIADILAEGNTAGAFCIEDVSAMAKVIQDAAFRFSSPSIYHEGDLDALRAELDAIVDLLIDAFKYRSEQRVLEKTA